MSSLRQEKQIRCRKQPVKGLGNSFVQVGVAGAEDNPHRSRKFLQPGSFLRAGSYRAQQILVQSEESRTSARRRVELPIQERYELIPGLRIPEESPDLPPIHPAKDQMIE